MSTFCRCKHSRAVHGIALDGTFKRNGSCLINQCPCDRFEKPLAIETPTDAELRREIRLLAEELRRLN